MAKNIKKPTNIKQSEMQVNHAVAQLLNNEYILRREAINRLLNPSRDINYECGYPNSIDASDYKGMYDREGYAKRVVRILPEDSWALPPEIYETEDEKNDTQFEKEWNELREKFRIFQYMQRIDCLSGIGRFGILIVGIDDGLDLEQPVEGIDLSTGEFQGGKKKRELLYLKAVDESAIEISSKENNSTSPRFGQPVTYTVQFDNPTAKGKTLTRSKVHWTRVIHIADNRESSEVYGVPRMQPVYNRLLDIRKVLSGSGEMFWKGGFPGYAAEIDPRIGPEAMQDYVLKTELSDSIKEQIKDYFNSMQRIIAISGFSIKSLQPQVSDPKGHVETHLKVVAFSLGIPYRIFLGTEEARLASSQDVKTWNKRLMNRQEQYLNPMVIRPIIDRFIALGILTQPKEYSIIWQKLDALSEQEQAEIVTKKTEAMAKYVTGGVEEIIPPIHYLTEFLKIPKDQAEQFLQDANLMEPRIEEPIEGE